MATTLVLTAEENGSLTPLIEALRHDFPGVFKEIKGDISAKSRPTALLGGGVEDMYRIDLALNVSSEAAKELIPILKLLKELLEKHTKQQMSAHIILNDGDEETEWESV